MIKHRRNINAIIRDHLLGQASEEDKERLQVWIRSSEENKENYSRLMRGADLANRYRQYAQVDEARAWGRFQKKHFPIRTFRWAVAARYAAIFILPVIGIAIWLWASSEIDTKPVISHETRVAMIRSERTGRQKATLILANGQKVDLQSAPARSLQDSVVQHLPQATTEKEKEKEKGEKATVADDVAENNKLVTNDDSEFWVTFEDGTRVHLNYNTTLKYPPHFNAASRTVYLEGEAYFQVAKDSKRPFRVVTANGIVKQYGTSFNVNTHATGTTKVVLVEGSISVLPNEGEECVMQPGELAVLQATTQSVLVCKVDLEPYIAWNNGRFVFDNCTLESLMNVISRWYNKDVLFESEDIKRMRFTGDIDRYGSITPILKAIQRVTHLEMETQGEKVIIRK